MNFDLIHIEHDKKFIKYRSLYRTFLYSIPLIFGLLIHIGKLFIYSQGPINATDFEIPINPLYYFWNILFPWNPLGLGSIASLNTFDMIYGLIATISFNNILISQILVLSIPPILGYIGVFYITRKILYLNIFGCIFASFFYAFSPPYLAWFSLPYMLGYSLIPILLYLILKLTNLCNTQINISYGIIVTYSLGVAIILGILTNIYFHSLPFILLSLSLVGFFLLLSKKIRINKRLIKRILLIASIIFVLYLSVGTIFKLQEINDVISDPEKQALILRTDTPDQVIEQFRDFYGKSTLNNIIRLGGGTPNNVKYSFFNDNAIGFIIPFFVFFGIVFLKYSSKRSEYVYLSCLINSLIIFFIIFFIREMSLNNNSILTNFVFSGVRRPERFLELLVIYYSISLAFTISVINKFLTNIKKIKIKNFHQLKKILQVTIFIFLLIVQILFVGLLTHPTDQTNTQFFAPLPKDFNSVQEFLDNEEYQTSNFNSDYRYLIIPSYVQMNAFTRYNYPNIFYAGSFSAKEAQEFVVTTNNMIADQNPEANIPLSLASVKYICVLPESFANEEFQAWRLNGYTRASGVNLFGDITTYKNFISELPKFELKDKKNSYVFENNEAISRVNIPSKIIVTTGRMVDVFQDLNLIDYIVPIQNYSLILKQSEGEITHNYLIKDYKSQTSCNVTIYNISDINFEFDYNFSKEYISPESIIIWSENKSISNNNGLISINSTIPKEKNSLSIWINIPYNDILNKSIINLDFIISSELLNNITFQLLDSDGNTISANFNKNITEINNNQYSLNLSINPLNMNFSWLKVILSGTPDSTREILLKNKIEYEQINKLKIYLNSLDLNNIHNENTSFPFLINENFNEYLIYPYSLNDTLIEYKINNKFNIKDSILYSVFNKSMNIGWIKLDEKIRWPSPLSITLDLNVSLVNKESRNFIHIPIFFGNVFDESWNLDLLHNNAYSIDTKHMVGNGFGNLWIINISNFAKDNNQLHLQFLISYNHYEINVYQKYTIFSIITIFFIIPLYFLEIKYKKYKEYDHF